MTFREAFDAVRVLSYDQTRIARMQSTDRVLRKVAGWRIHHYKAYRECLLAIYGNPYAVRDHGGPKYRVFGKPKASAKEVRERAMREAS